MDETMPRMVDTDLRLTECRRPLVDMLYLGQVALLHLTAPALGLAVALSGIGKDWRCK